MLFRRELGGSPSRAALLAATCIVAIATPGVARAQTAVDPDAVRSGQTVPTGQTAPTGQAAPVAAGEESVTAGAPDAAPVGPQDAPPAEAAQGEIVVTGSRIQRDGYSAPTPTKVLTADAIEARGSPTIGEFLNETPSFRNTTGSTTATQSTLGAGQNYADLRGLGNIRTLTLVDSRRFVPSSAFGQVDLNLIPTIMVERVDVVTGGASAAYGSDAVTGVVNVIVNKRLEGIKGDVTQGISQEGDNHETRFALAAGTGFDDDRGHLVVGGEYFESTGVTSYFFRDWGREQHGLVTYAGARPAGAPSRLYARGVQFTNITYGGLILGANADTNAANGRDALRGIQFGQGGVPTGFNYGNAATFGAANTLATDFTGGNPGLFPQDRFPIAVPLERYVAMAHLDYEVAPGVTLFAEGNYGRSGTDNQSPPVRDVAATGPAAAIIRRENAFLPTAIAAILDGSPATAADNIASFALGREYDDFGKVATRNRNTTYRVAGGFNADFGSGWKLDGYYQWGRNTLDARVERLRIEQNFRFALDAVRTAGGGIACAATVPGGPRFDARASGCVPINVFGVGSPSQAAIDYVTGTIRYEVETEQRVGSLMLQGEPFALPGGPVAIAVGVEARREEADATADAISQANGFNYSNPKAFSGGYTVKEAFGEAIAPILKDQPFAELLELNGAVRYTDYSTSGGVTTWKVGATWQPVDDIRFRATRSRDIRAPTNSELFAETSATQQIRNPFSGATSQLPVVNQSSPDLEPERAKTTTAGVVLTPGFIPGLSISVDYFDVNIRGAISSFTAQTVVDNCFAELSTGASPFFCNFVARSGAGAATQISTVSVQLLNIASLRARGLDIEASYSLPVLGGDLTARAYATYTRDLIFDDATGARRSFNAAGVLVSQGGRIDRAGSVGGFTGGQQNSATNSPHWIARGAFTYDRDPFQFTVQGRYIGGGAFDNTLVGPGDRDYDPASPISIDDNRVGERFYVDLSGQVDIIDTGRRKLQFYGVVSNLTDVDPPFPVIAIAGLYDRIGRAFRVGFRFNY